MLDIGRGSREGVVSNEVSIKNYGRTRQWSAALRFFREEIRLGVQLVPSHYVATVSACGKGAQWQHALSVLNEMWEAKLEPNVISYSAGISACEKREQWQRALALLTVAAGARAAERDAGGEAEAQRHFLQRWDQFVREGRAVAAGACAAQRDAEGEAEARTLVSYSAGISACEKGEQWWRALALLSEMRKADAEPDVI
ncbi:unnamed protein product, partial [Prorocentrum cordatum]